MPATIAPGSVIPLGPPPGNGAPAGSPRGGPGPSNPSAPNGPNGPAPTTDFPLGAASAAGGALAGAATGANNGAGPSLDSATGPLGKKERDAVSRALDDPNAPGRSLAGDNTSQPHLTPGEMATRGRDGDLNAMGAGSMLASAHEANRPSEFDRGLNATTPQFPNNFAPSGNNFGPNPNGPTMNGQNLNNGAGGRGYSNPGERVDNGNMASATRAPEPVEKPWPTLIFTVTLLLASVSLNFYLGWVAYDSRFRYRELLAQSSDMPLPV